MIQILDVMNKSTTSYKQRVPLLTVIALALVPFFGACDSYDNPTGSDIMPEYSKGVSKSYTLPLTFRTVSADMSDQTGTHTGVSYNNIYVNSSYGYVGTIPNTLYGNVSCEYLTQFYCPAGFRFSEEPASNKIDSAFVELSYADYTGKGDSPMEIKAYKLKKALPFQKYSVDDLSAYVDMSDTYHLGSVTYTAAKGNASSSDVKRIKIPLRREFGQEFYDLAKAKSPIFASQESFDQFFPGVYLKTTTGAGSILQVVRSSLAFYYSMPDTLVRKSTGVKDSIVSVAHVQHLSHTIEVPQLARFANKDINKLINSNDGYAYIKSPAGVFTEVTIPTVKIAQILSEAEMGKIRELNSVPMIITGEGETNNAYALTSPSDLILMPTDSVASFFAKELTEADAPYSTYVSTKTSAESKTYSFGNIVQMIKQHIKAHPDRDLRVAIIPILRSQDSSSSSSSSYNQSSSSTPISISNLILPSAMRISTEKENNELKFVITEKRAGAPF